MAIIVGDIHGNAEMASAFLNYKAEEVHVALGDLVDSRQKSDLNEETACLDLLLQSSALLLWGNHDLAYLPERPWQSFGNFGDLAFREKYQASRGRFSAAHAVDGWLCTHAGVNRHVAKLIPTDVITCGEEAIADWLNLEFTKQLAIPNPDSVAGEPCFGYGPLFQIPVCRGGHHGFGGIFWCDFEGEQTSPAPAVGKQIFGHCHVPFPERGNSIVLYGGEVLKGPEWLNVNANEGHFWVYDTKTDELVDLHPGADRVRLG